MTWENDMQITNTRQPIWLLNFIEVRVPKTYAPTLHFYLKSHDEPSDENARWKNDEYTSSLCLPRAQRIVSNEKKCCAEKKKIRYFKWTQKNRFCNQTFDISTKWNISRMCVGVLVTCHFSHANFAHISFKPDIFTIRRIPFANEEEKKADRMRMTLISVVMVFLRFDTRFTFNHYHAQQLLGNPNYIISLFQCNSWIFHK